MTIECVKEISSNNLTSIETILEWNPTAVNLSRGEYETFKVAFLNEELMLNNESVDKIIIADLLHFTLNIDHVIKESKRILKRDGRIFISFFNQEEDSLLNRIFNRRKNKEDGKNEERNISTMDRIAQFVSDNNLLIDKNFIIEKEARNLICFEVIKLENDDLKKKAFT